jgi:hypothetical protein
LASGTGIVDNYEERLSGSPDIEMAKTEAVKEFPADATVLWFLKKPDYSQMAVQSKTLGTEMSDPDNPNGDAFVEFQTMTSDGKDTHNPGKE